MKKSHVIKLFLFEYKFVLIEWKYILISFKCILLNINLFWLNKNIFWYHIKILFATFQQPYLQYFSFFKLMKPFSLWTFAVVKFLPSVCCVKYGFNGVLGWISQYNRQTKEFYGALSFKSLIKTCFPTWQLKHTLLKIKARRKGIFVLIFCHKVKPSE